jgi:glyoxylase-like metal-dependent hydrolase (beta-lactamase superfamily II)
MTTFLFAYSAIRLSAQCPDGSPPPCRAQPTRAAPPPNSVAVLYFDNLSPDTADAYLAEGLTEELTHAPRYCAQSSFDAPRSRRKLVTLHPHIAGALAALLFAAPVDAQTPRDVVARALAAMGGEQAVRGIQAVTTDYYSMTFALGQEETPESPPRASVQAGRITADYGGTRRAGSFEVRTVAGAVNRLRRVTAGGIGMLETNGSFAPDQPGTVAGEEASLRRALGRLLLAALDNPAALTALPEKAWRAAPHDGLRYATGPDTLDLYFDRRTGLPTVTVSVADDPILGDRRTESWFTRWQETAGVRFARQSDVYVNGRLNTHSVFTAVTVNPELPESLFAIPDSIATRAQKANAEPPPPVVTLVQLAPGVWRAEGGSHHSLIVEQSDGLIVVEAPQTSRRSQAVLDTLRARFPAKPVAMVVNTHHHWDHSGGVRAYLAAGVAVVTSVGNAAFVRNVGVAPKIVAPDALSRRGRPLQVRTVDDSLVIGSGAGRVVVYRLPTAHVEGMLAAYVPAARILFNSDVLSPGTPLAPAGSKEIVGFVKARGITVERVVGGHGGIANWADVEQAATQ